MPVVRVLTTCLLFLYYWSSLNAETTLEEPDYNGDYYKKMAKSLHSKLYLTSPQHKPFSKMNLINEQDIIRSSIFPKKPITRKQVLFLHFHKAGGTSICRYFKDTGTWRVPKKFCICEEKITSAILFSHSRKKIRIQNLDKLFQKSHADICMLEEKWIRPHYFFQIRQIYTGFIVTALRQPWNRFLSNYEKDYTLCSRELTVDDTGDNKKYSKLHNMTIEVYSELNPSDCPKSHYLSANTNRPNFYVRMLNGLSVESYSNGDGVLNVMTEAHLEQAKEVLMMFDVVLILEESIDHMNMKLQQLTGSNQNLTQKSNNPFSAAYLHLTNKTKRLHQPKHWQGLDRASLPPTDQFKQQFERENRLDIQLYQWAMDRFGG
mmetsp:Transcript_11138/g.18192  ORF Transcript_11138/g.18192 Transcript_11138/m.18192 type:complete len:376 (-) Transcript_11138:85-1212(-)